MLVISRRRGESVQIGPDIEVMVTRVMPNGQVRLAIKAPPDVKIARDELLVRTEAPPCKST